MNIDRRWYAVLAVVLACSVCYLIGKKQGHLDEKLTINSLELKKSDDSIKSVQIRTDSARRKDAVLDSTHDVIRQKVQVVHDTLYVESDIPDSTDEAIYSPAIARLIATDDSLISAQKHSLALQDTLIASLRVGISLRDERIHLLEKSVLPSKTSRFIAATKWLAIGAVIGVAYSHK